MAEQAFRATTFVDRLVDAGEISPAVASVPRPLLVVGAGFVGVTAALTAVTKGVLTTIVDHAQQPFFLDAISNRTQEERPETDSPFLHRILEKFHLPLIVRSDAAKHLSLT